MKRNLAKSLLVIGCAVGGFGVAAANDQVTSIGASPDSVRVESVTVPYDASELSDPRGAKRLFFRIRQAASEVCNIASHEVGYERWEEHACETAAVARAVKEAGEPALIDYYTRLGGRV